MFFIATLVVPLKYRNKLMLLFLSYFSYFYFPCISALFSVKDQKDFRLVPDISMNQSTAICYESNPSDPCSLWNIKNSYFPARKTVSCLIKSETSTSCYFSLPNIIDSMNRIDLLDLDSFHTISKDLPFNIKEEPMEEDIRVDFLNIKDVYFKHAEGIEDSFLCVYVKTGCKVNGVKLFLKQLQDGVSRHYSQGKYHGLLLLSFLY